MINYAKKEGNGDSITITGHDYDHNYPIGVDDVKCMLEFMYTGNVKNLKDHADGLLVLSDKVILFISFQSFVVLFLTKSFLSLLSVWAATIAIDV